jgi:hypothetical protein
MELPQTFKHQLQIPPCTSNTSNQFFVQCKMHITLPMDLSNVVFVQIKFKLFTNSLYLYIHISNANELYPWKLS